MSSSQQRTSLEQRDLQAYDGKFPEITCIPKCKRTTFQPILKERKLPFLTPDNISLDNKEKLFESQPLMNSWKNAVVKTKRIKQECVSAYGLSNSSENTAVPCLSQGTEKYPAIPNPFPVVQKTQSGANQFPNSSDSNEDSRLPPLYLLPSTLPQSLFEGYYKSSGDIAMRNTDRKQMPWIKAPVKNSELHCGTGELGAVRGDIAMRNTDRKRMPWIKAPLKNSELHCGTGELGAVRGDIAMRNTDRKGMPRIKAPVKNSELHCGTRDLGAVRLKKYNQCSSLVSFPEGSKFRTGYHFPDPVIGAPPQFLQRLAELAALECETIHQEKSGKIRKTKKQER